MPQRPPKPRPGRPLGSRTFDAPSAQAFGTVVRQARLASGLSQEALAHSASLDRSYFSKLERGLSQPTLFAILNISQALGLKASTLVGHTQKRLEEHTAASRP